jgi:glycosyltransferase involved in cell wall biosynthesis
MVTVSVIVPFRDAGPYLGEAIASVQDQTWRDWELLLIDDGSTDDSPLIAEEAATRDPRIRLLARPVGVPGNAAAARNLGIEWARGEFVAFLDADDVYERTNLQSRLECFEGRSDVAMVYGPTRWWHPGAEERDWTERMRREAGRVHHAPELVVRVLLLQQWQVPCTCGVLIRRPALEVTGGFEESFHLYEDQTLWAKLLLRFPVYVTDVVGARYRQHERSATAHAERSGVYHYRRPHESRVAFLTWVDDHARSSGLAAPSVQRALRLASARYGNRSAGLSLADRLTLMGHTLRTIVGHTVNWTIGSARRLGASRRPFGARRPAGR